MENIMNPMGKVLIDIIKHNRYTILFSGLCKYKGEIYSFYAFSHDYCTELGYPKKFTLENHTQDVYRQVRPEECEVIYSPQAKVKYTYSHN